MHYFKKGKLFLIFLMHSASMVVAQDFTFSQYHEIPLLRNPAMSNLFYGNLCVRGALRQQWQSVTTPYKTGVTSLDLKIPTGGESFFTVSGLFGMDKAGDSRLGRNNFIGSVNYFQPLNQRYAISLAFLSGLTRASFDPSRLTFDDQFQNGQYNPGNVTRQTFTNTQRNYWDVSVGATFSNLNDYNESISDNRTFFYLGLAAYHLNKQNVSFGSDPMYLDSRYVASGGFLSSWDQQWNEIYLFADYMLQGGNRQGLIGVSFRRYLDPTNDYGFPKAVAFGANYRWGDAIIPTAKIFWDAFSLGLSYDANVSKLTRASLLRGGFELTFSYRGLFELFGKSSEFYKCPNL